MKALTLILVLLLSGCEAIQPFAHVDGDGYEAGVRGTWKAVAASAESLLKPAPAAGRNGSFKQVLSPSGE